MFTKASQLLAGCYSLYLLQKHGHDNCDYIREVF